MAVTRGLGRIVATKADIAPHAPEKVLGLRRAWGEEKPPDLVDHLIDGLAEAAAWADSHHAALAELLAEERWVGVPVSLLLPCLEGCPSLARDEPPVHLAGYQSFRDGGVPWTRHVEWLIGQMARCSQCYEAESEAIHQIFASLPPG